MKKAIILFSGGLDSTTCLAIAKSQGYDCYALSFQYGQKHHVEIENAMKIARNMGVVEHKILTLPLDQWGGSSLTDEKLTIGDYKQGTTTEIPNTYVPARNTIFLSLALAWGEVIGAYDIFYGANCIDYSNYPDCRPDYVKAFENLAAIATKGGLEGNTFKIHTPLLMWDKAEIVKEGMRLHVDYSLTISCYRANAKGEACGSCESCAHRKKGFKEANCKDVTSYCDSESSL